VDNNTAVVCIFGLIVFTIVGVAWARAFREARTAHWEAMRAQREWWDAVVDKRRDVTSKKEDGHV
jgi:hypothetical protein